MYHNYTTIDNTNETHQKYKNKTQDTCRRTIEKEKLEKNIEGWFQQKNMLLISRYEPNDLSKVDVFND